MKEEFKSLGEKIEELRKSLIASFDKPKKGVPLDVWMYGCKFAGNILNKVEENVKETTQNVQKRVKEEIDYYEGCNSLDKLRKKVDKIFKEEFGEKLIK